MERTNNFDRMGDWCKFSAHMVDNYLAPVVKKYGAGGMFNDLLHYTGLRVICWNILKYALRLWTGTGKPKDFEKIAHYSQMGWTLKNELDLQAPFFKSEDPDHEFFILRGSEKDEEKDEAEKAIMELMNEFLKKEEMINEINEALKLPVKIKKEVKGPKDEAWYRRSSMNKIHKINSISMRNHQKEVNRFWEYYCNFIFNERRSTEFKNLRGYFFEKFLSKME